MANTRLYKEQLRRKKIFPEKVALRLLLAGGIAAVIAIFVWGISRRSSTTIAEAMVGGIVVIFSYLLLNNTPDTLRSEAAERMLWTASSTLENLRDGLTKEGCRTVCEQLLPETQAHSVAITDHERVLAFVGEFEQFFPEGASIKTPATKTVLETGKMQTFSFATPSNVDVPRDSLLVSKSFSGVPCGIVVPLIVREQVVGTIKFYYRSYKDIDHTQYAIATGFGELLSTQLSQYELDRQAQLTAQAEIKALQAQINPHFLFNTLNTIAALTRTNPMQARELLRDFAQFYRQTLKNSSDLIPLSKELEQTRRYLSFEQARFGEERIEWEENFEPGCEGIEVPPFIIQPIVENAVRYAMREEGPLHIKVAALKKGERTYISVDDDGVGMTQSNANKMMVPASREEENKGTGIALKNISGRLKRFYGPGSGINIESEPGQGTHVTLTLVGKPSAMEHVEEEAVEPRDV